jgi:toxin secretion/phage lysis holin
MDIIVFLNNFHFRNELLELIVPVAMMAVDFLTGSFGAWMTHTFQSARMRAGLTKKVGEMSIIVIGALLSYALRLPPQIMAGISLYIMFMELMSICENAKKMGAPLPGFVSKVLNTVDATLKEEDVSEAIKKIAELEEEIKQLKEE